MLGTLPLTYYLSLVKFDVYLTFKVFSSGDRRSEDDLFDVAEADFGGLLRSILTGEDHAISVNIFVGNTNEVVGAIWAQDHNLVKNILEHVEVIIDNDAAEDIILVDLSAPGLIGVVLVSEVLCGDPQHNSLIIISTIDYILVFKAD